MSSFRATLPQFNDYVHMDIRIPAAIREHLHNAFGAKATKVCILEIRQGESLDNYLVFIHNGQPFQSDSENGSSCQDVLRKCLSYNTSSGSSGALGNGMPTTMIITDESNDPSNTTMKVLSRDTVTNEFIGAHAYLEGGSTYKVDPINTRKAKSIIKKIESHIGPDNSIKEWANVIYINKISNFTTTAKSGGMVFVHNQRTISEMVSDDIIESFTDKIEVYSGVQSKDKRSDKYNLWSDGEYQCAFAKEKFRIDTTVDFIPTEAEYKKFAGRYEVVYTMRHYPQFKATRDGNRAARLSDGPDVGRQAIHRNPITHPYRIYSHICDGYGSTEDRRRMDRVNNEPVYLSKQKPHNFWRLFPTLSNIERQRFTDYDAIKHAWNVVHNSQGIDPPNDRITLLVGGITIDVAITYKGDISKYPIPGGINSLFLSSNHKMLRSIADQGLAELALKSHIEGLDEFVQKVESYYPKNEIDLMDLPIDKQLQTQRFPKVCVWSVKPKKQKWEPTKKFNYASQQRVLLTLEDDTPLTGDIEILDGNKSVSIFQETQQSKGLYKIIIPDLFKLVNGTPDDITEAEYSDMSLSVGPKPNILIRWNNKTYRIINKIDVPKRKTTGNHGPHLNTKPKGWAQMDPAIVGQYYDYLSELHLNSDNSLVARLFKDTHGKYTSRQEALYYELKEQAVKRYSEIKGQLTLKNIDEMKINIDAEGFALNAVFLSVLDISSNASYLLKQLQEDDEQEEQSQILNVLAAA